MATLTRPRTISVVAHRGASEAAPEHTIAAYRKAIDDGADLLECDIRLTRDGVPVCVHDRRVDRTSNGRGIVSTLELADLAELDFGSWHSDPAAGLDGDGDPEEPDRDRTGVLTLDRLVDVVLNVDRPVGLAIEAKHPTRYAGLVERTVVDVLGSYGLLRPAADCPEIRLMSFSLLSLRRVHALAPDLPTVLLMRRVPWWLRDGTLPPRVPIAGPALSVLRRDPEYVERVHQHGGRVHVWTVDDPADVEFVVSLGVDAVITNRPGHVRARLATPD